MKSVGIYTGNFQPPHRGNLNAFNYLKKITGQDTFIGARKQRRTVDEPLSFMDRKQIWAKHGVPSDKVLEVSNIYMPREILQKFDPKSTALVVLRDKDSVQEIMEKTSGIPNYFLPYRGNENNLRPMMEHGYIFEYPSTIMEMDGVPLTNKTIRRIMSSPKITPDQKKAMLKKVMGWYDVGLFERMEKVLSNPQARPAINESFIEVIRKMIRESITELTNTPIPSTDMTNNSQDQMGALQTSPLGMSKDEQDKLEADQEQERSDKMKELDRDIKVTKKETDFFNQKLKKNKIDQLSKEKDLQQMKAGNLV